jgi:hypothetical protein
MLMPCLDLQATQVLEQCSCCHPRLRLHLILLQTRCRAPSVHMAVGARCLHRSDLTALGAVGLPCSAGGEAQAEEPSLREEASRQEEASLQEKISLQEKPSLLEEAHLDSSIERSVSVYSLLRNTRLPPRTDRIRDTGETPVVEFSIYWRSRTRLARRGGGCTSLTQSRSVREMVRSGLLLMRKRALSGLRQRPESFSSEALVGPRALDRGGLARLGFSAQPLRLGLPT